MKPILALAFVLTFGSATSLGQGAGGHGRPISPLAPPALATSSLSTGRLYPERAAREGAILRAPWSVAAFLRAHLTVSPPSPVITHKYLKAFEHVGWVLAYSAGAFADARTTVLADHRQAVIEENPLLRVSGGTRPSATKVIAYKIGYGVLCEAAWDYHRFGPRWGRWMYGAGIAVGVAASLHNERAFQFSIPLF